MQGLNICMKHDDRGMFAFHDALDVVHWKLHDQNGAQQKRHDLCQKRLLMSTSLLCVAWVEQAAFALPDEIFRLGITVLTNVADLCNRSEYLAGCQYIIFSNNACIAMQNGSASNAERSRGSVIARNGCPTKVPCSRSHHVHTTRSLSTG